jgi:NADH-quinone oxidoreductase subunit J
MSVELATFYAFSTVLVLAGLGVILLRNPVHAALSLVLAFFTASAIWILLRAEFLAIVLVLVYVGAVMVLFLFVVMMLDINLDRLREGFWAFLVPGVIVGAIMIAEMILVVSRRYFGPGRLPRPAETAAGYSNTRALGHVLYTDYVYAFEIAAVVLLVAIVAAIALTMRKRKDTKYVDPARQVLARREDRVRLVTMASEKE